MLAFSISFCLKPSALNSHFNLTHSLQNTYASSLDMTSKTVSINKFSRTSSTTLARYLTSYHVKSGGLDGSKLSIMLKMSCVLRLHIFWNIIGMSLSFAEI